MTSTIEAYAAVLAALAAGRDRAEVLKKAGIEEADWALMDAEFQRQLDEDVALDDGVPPLAQRFSKAFEAALDANDETPALDFDAYAAITRRLRRGDDIGRAVQEGRFDLASYLQSHRYWVKRMLADADLRRRLDEG